MQDKSDSRGPVALVTGASRGLGRETALALGREGYSVIVNCRHAEKDAAEVIRELRGSAVAIMADVGDEEQVRAMAEEIEKTYGRLDVIINNAGLTRDGLLIRQKEADWDEVIKTNLKGPFLVIRALTPLMIRSGGGHIINIASYSGVKGKAGQSAYSASKAGLIGLTYVAAREFAGYNISVNSILPGYMGTEMGMKADKAMQAAKEEGLSGKLSSPADVAWSIVCLLHNRGITGQVISMDSRLI